MPLLLLLPLLAIALIVAVLLLLPLSLRQRYRAGHARRRAYRWMVVLNAWLFALSVAVFLATAWFSTLWIADALRDAALGLCAGIVVGIAGLVLTRFEEADGMLYYAPNRWLALALTLLVAARIGFGLWLGWRRATAGGAASLPAWQGWIEAGGLWAIGGLLLGYAMTYAWGLRMRLARMERRRR
jgi:cytochrome c biogenesis protein CcdA